MKVVHDYEDVIKIGRQSSVVIWGAGNLGRMLLQEIRVNGLKDVYIYDKDEASTKDLNEHISMEWIKHESNKLVFIIAVANNKIAEDISGQILMINSSIEIYRYMPKDHAYLSRKLSQEGFYNGKERCRPLGDTDARQLLERKINNEQSFLLSRWGSVEGDAVYADLAGMFSETKAVPLKNNAGFYPLDRNSIHKFAECTADAARKIDVLIAGCWCSRIEELYRIYSSDAILVTSAMMYPFWDGISWTRALKGKKVLVIHPFAKLMERQYMYRNRLFASPDILPEMELITYKAVQSMNGSSEFKTWFDALDKMEYDISSIDFDIALIGCGAYGMPLGAFIKSQMHKRAIHMGGSLQILFGIKGKRWESNGYDYQQKLYNDYWVRPTDDLKPENYKSVEDGCYW